MSVNGYGDHGEPIYGQTPSTRADLQAAADYAKKVGTRISGTSEERLQATATQKVWNGLEWFETDTGLNYIRRGTVWQKWTGGHLGDDEVMRVIRDNNAYAPMAGGDPGVLSGDWNNALGVGQYRIFAGYTNTNAPADAFLYGTLIVFAAGPNFQSRTQQYFAANGDHYWRTAWNGNDWGVWRKAAYTSVGNRP